EAGDGELRPPFEERIASLARLAFSVEIRQGGYQYEIRPRNRIRVAAREPAIFDGAVEFSELQVRQGTHVLHRPQHRILWRQPNGGVEDVNRFAIPASQRQPPANP